MHWMKKFWRDFWWGEVIETHQHVKGTLRRYSKGQVTLQDADTGEETPIDLSALEGPRRWLACATQGGGQMHVPELTPEEAATWVAEKCGPVIYQDRGAGLIFYKLK